MLTLERVHNCCNFAGLVLLAGRASPPSTQRVFDVGLRGSKMLEVDLPGALLFHLTYVSAGFNSLYRGQNNVCHSGSLHISHQYDLPRFQILYSGGSVGFSLWYVACGKKG